MAKRKNNIKKAVFLDRDGVLIEDTGYPHLPEHLKLKKDILPYLRRLKKLGYLLIIVTNQSGIARGIFTVEQYEEFQLLVEEALRAENVYIDAVYYCPYLNNGSIPNFAHNHVNRKPNPGMILMAAAKFEINISESIMIGDRMSDIINLSGLRSYLIRGQSPIDSGIKVYDNLEDVLKDAGII